MWNLTDTNVTTMLGFSPPVAGILGFLAITVSVITVAGNLLVVTSFFVERALRTPTNYFIASLAVTDLLIGVFSMNFFTLYLLLGTWPLGELFCDLWLSLDYTACLTSQYTVFFITVDRYCSVKIPAKYRNWRTDRRVLIMVGATWILPSSIFFTSIMGWPYFTQRKNRRPSHVCFAEFTNYPIFNTILTIGYYWITLVVMCGLYAGIYHVALNLQLKSDAKRRNMTNLVTLANRNQEKPGGGQVSKTTDDEDEDDSSTCKMDCPAKKITTKDQSNPDMMNLAKKETRRSRLSKKISSTVNYRKSSSKKKKKVDEAQMDKERSSSPMLPSDSDNGMPDIPTPKVVHKPTKKSKSKAEPETITRSSVHARIESPLVMVDMIPFEKETTQHSILTTDISESSASHSAPIDFDYLTTSGMEGLKYIDQESIMSIYSSDNIRHILEAIPPNSQGNQSVKSGNNTTSPIWKKRGEISFWSDAKNSEYNTLLGEGKSEDQMRELHPDGIVNITDNGVDNREPANSRSSLATITTMVAATKSSLAIPADNTSKSPNYHHHHHPSDPKQNNLADDDHIQIEEKKTFLQHIQSLKLRFRRRKKMKQKVERGRTENRARKALRTITLILGAFVACWTPYHIFVLVKGFCDVPSEDYTCINEHVYNISYWLCYLNSPINPFCYALANAQFKKTFLRILRLDLHRT